MRSKEEDEIIGEALKTIHRIFRRADSKAKTPSVKKEEKPSPPASKFPDYMKPLLS